MTATHWITLAAALLGSATALILGYQQRKQMRQSELFKLDPTVGIVPPPSVPYVIVVRTSTKVLSFVRRYGIIVFGIVLPLIGVIPDLILQRRLTVNSLAILCIVAFNVVTVLISRIYDMVGKLIDVDSKQTDTVDKVLDQLHAAAGHITAHSDLLKQHTDIASGLLDRLTVAEERIAALELQAKPSQT
jgi:hypothetical protein